MGILLGKRGLFVTNWLLFKFVVRFLQLAVYISGQPNYLIQSGFRSCVGLLGILIGNAFFFTPIFFSGLLTCFH